LGSVGDLGTLMEGVAANGLGVFCEIVRTGVSEDWSDLTLLSFLLSLAEVTAAAAFGCPPPAAAFSVSVLAVLVEATLELFSDC